MTENRHHKESEFQLKINENDEIQIDWIGILRQLISIRKKLYKATIVGLIIGSVIAFSIPKQYSVSVTLSPEMGNSKSANGLASMAASFLGGNIGNESPDALNASLAPDIIASTPFLLELLDSRVSTKDKNIDTTLTAYLDKQKSPWWGYIVRIPSAAITGIKSFFNKKNVIQSETKENGAIELNEKDTQKLAMLRHLITVEIDSKTAITTLTVTLQDPKVVAIVADSVVSKLQQYIITYRTSKAKEDCKYLEQLYKERQKEYYEAQQRYAHYVDANSNIVFQSTLAERERIQNDMNLAFQIYSQVAQQLQVARAKVQEEKPIFAVVEPAVIPLQPYGSSRKVIIIGIVLLVIIGTGIWELLGKKYWINIKNELKTSTY